MYSKLPTNETLCPDFDDADRELDIEISKRCLSGSAHFPEKPTSRQPPSALLKNLFNECFLLFCLALKLWSYLGVGWKWFYNFNRLLLYAMFLLPGFVQMIIFYFFSPRVIRSVAYGAKPRQRLDLYLPKNLQLQQHYPIVIYVTGGAWTIGYKAWGALLGRRLSRHGALVACLDYRNFPQGDVVQMLEDVNEGIAWTLAHAPRHQGDVTRVALVGQSAGAHLAAMALIRQAETAVSNAHQRQPFPSSSSPKMSNKSSASSASSSAPLPGSYPPWHPSDLLAFVGVSGAYDLEALSEHLHRRGLYRNLFRKIIAVDGKPALSDMSPLEAILRLIPAAAAAAPPPPSSAEPADEEYLKAVVRSYLPSKVLLLHGTADKSVPYEGSVKLDLAFQALGVPSHCRLLPGRTHTSLLLEGAMAGGRDVLSDAVLWVVRGGAMLPAPTDHTHAPAGHPPAPRRPSLFTSAGAATDDADMFTSLYAKPYVSAQPVLWSSSSSLSAAVDGDVDGDVAANGGAFFLAADGGTRPDGLVQPSTTLTQRLHPHPHACQDSSMCGEDNKADSLFDGGLGFGFQYPPLCPRPLCRLAGWVCPF